MQGASPKVLVNIQCPLVKSALFRLNRGPSQVKVHAPQSEIPTGNPGSVSAVSMDPGLQRPRPDRQRHPPGDCATKESDILAESASVKLSLMYK